MSIQLGIKPLDTNFGYSDSAIWGHPFMFYNPNQRISEITTLMKRYLYYKENLNNTLNNLLKNETVNCKLPLPETCAEI